MSWLYLPSTVSSSSPGLACWVKDCELGSTIWASRIAPFATLSGKLTQPASWLRAWKKAPWMRLLSGPTLQPSTLDSGAERWIASLPDSRAKTYLLPAGGQDSTAPAPGCSSRSSALPTIAVRGSSFWRTSQASLLPPPPLWTRKKASSTSVQPPESWENWPTAGGMRNGSLFQRPTWAPAMAAPDGFVSHGAMWQTPKASEEDSGSGMNSRGEPKLKAQANMWLTPHGMSGMEQETGKAGGGGEFAKQATNWTTPSATDVERGGSLTEKMTGTSLTQQVRSVWATPRATDVEKGGPNCRGGRGDPILAGQVCQWPTPTYQDSEQAGGAGTIQRGMRGHSLNSMAMLVSARPTPAARDSKGANSEEHALVTGGGRKHMDQLANFVAYSPLAQPIRDGLQSSSTTQNSRRHLNPLFGAWLMGWPSTWVIAEPHDSNALATASWRSALRSHLSSFFNEPGLHREVA